MIPPRAIIFEFCSCGDVYDLLHNWKTSLSWKLRLKIAQDVAEGIKYLHSQPHPIAHLDLKSPNILLKSIDPNASVCAKIIDFGTAQEVTSPLSGRKVDNPVWLAPEILSNSPYNHLVDTYAFGVMLYEIATRKDYFEGYTFVPIEEAVTSGERPPIGPRGSYRF